MDWIGLKGFEYGYPPNGENYYGLWAPVFNCFVFVHHDFGLISRLQWILSSKLLLIIVQFEDHVCAQNLIDNTCCHDWTVATVSKQSFATAFKDSGSTQSHPIKSTVGVTTDDVIYIRRYCLFCVYWYKILEKKTYSTHLEKMTEDAIGGEKWQCIQWIYHTLWLSDNIEETDKKINDKYHSLESRLN